MWAKYFYWKMSLVLERSVFTLCGEEAAGHICSKGVLHVLPTTLNM